MVLMDKIRALHFRISNGDIGRAGGILFKTIKIRLTRGPWAFALCLTTNLTMGQSSKSCTYTLFLFQDVEIEHAFALCAAVSEIIADFQNGHIWA